MADKAPMTMSSRELLYELYMHPSSRQRADQLWRECMKRMGAAPSDPPGKQVAECCEMCNDGDGRCVYPYTGLAPHTHEVSKSESGETAVLLGGTRFLPRACWPANYRPDINHRGLGTYTHCLNCGRPG